jgi:hypothetical protein
MSVPTPPQPFVPVPAPGTTVSVTVPALPTQMRHPWRSTLRTVVAVVVVALPLVPSIVQNLGVASVPVVAGVVTAFGGVTRVLAMPSVEMLLRQYRLTNWLAAEAPTPTPPGLPGDAAN